MSFILSSAFVTSSVDDSGVYESKFGQFNFTELEETLYDIELLTVPLPESALVPSNQGGKEKVRNPLH